MPMKKGFKPKAVECAPMDRLSDIENMTLLHLASSLVRSECECAQRANDYGSVRMLERLQFACRISIEIKTSLGDNS